MDYLIIGGTTKAATTSVFNYLAAHPHICGSNTKETRFFLDVSYPLKSKYRIEDGLEKYEEFFGHCKDPTKLRLEATPDYLYSPGTPRKINQSLEGTKIIVSLREPISRLVSWYRFAVQRGLIPTQMSIDEYIERQFRTNNSKETKQYMRVLEQGRYSRFISRYIEEFTREKVLVIYFEDISNDPLSVVESICKFAQLDPTYYQKFSFEKYNPTIDLRKPGLHHAYNKLRFNIRRYTHNKPIIHTPLKHIRLLIEPLYIKVNKKRDQDNINISSKLMEALIDYYQKDIDILINSLGYLPPWDM
jgi:hypothetical protein